MRETEGQEGRQRTAARRKALAAIDLALVKLTMARDTLEWVREELSPQLFAVLRHGEWTETVNGLPVTGRRAVLVGVYRDLAEAHAVARDFPVEENWTVCETYVDGALLDGLPVEVGAPRQRGDGSTQ